MAVIGGYFGLAKGCKRQADVTAEYRPEQKEQNDKELSKLQELEPGNILARELKLDTAKDEAEVRRTREEVAKGDCFLCCILRQLSPQKMRRTGVETEFGSLVPDFGRIITT